MACEQQILELISRYVDGETSTVETSRAEAHLDTCPECKEMVQEWRRGIEMLDWTYSRALPEDAAELTFEVPAPAPEREQRRWMFPMPSLRGLAAAAVLACIALIVSTVYQQLIPLPMLGQSLATARRAQTVLVADGIRLELGPDSEISRLGDKWVRLSHGSAKIEVSHVPGFRIQTRKLDIFDEGTKFEVHSDSRTDRVTVTEGSVLVREGKDEYHVGAGETLTSIEDQQHNKTGVGQNGGNNMPSQPHSFIAIGFIPILILIVFVIIFWARMLIDALARQFKDSGMKVAWVLAILLGGTLGAILFGQLLEAVVYYIADRRITQLQGILSGQLLWAFIYYFKMYKKDHPQERFRHLLVGRKGDQRVIQWWNVLVAAVISVAAFSYGITWLTYEASTVTLLVSVTVGIMFVAACIVQVLSYPLDVLTDFGTGETPSQEVRNKRYPLPFLVARRNGRRVIMWANIAILAVVATIAYAHIASDFLGIVDHGLPRFVGAYFGLIALMVMYALLVPLNKPSKLDDEDFNPNAPAGRISRFTVAARKGDRRVILWRNVPLTMLVCTLGCAAGLGIVSIIYPTSGMPLPMWIFLGIIGVLGSIFGSLITPLDKLPSLDDKGNAPARMTMLTLVGRMGDRRVIMWWNVLRMAMGFYVLIVAGSEILIRVIQGTWREELIYFGLFAVVMILSINIGRLLQAPLDKLPSLDDDPPNE